MMKEKRNSASLLGLFMSDFIGTDEESSDESFRVEDHSEHSDLSNDDEDESTDGGKDIGSDLDDSEADEPSNKKHVNNLNTDTTSKNVSTLSAVDQLVEQTKSSANITAKLLTKPVCCACLSDRSDDSNEIVTCDSCKITVHEGCYGISDSASISSTVSSCSTEPWFCEPCKANIKNPDCELCPNKGGIFKETDCGKWVHLVCALYVPGVAFGEVDQLSSVTLFEMQYSKWGAKTCSLCENDHFARTGVCIGCDAGMCKTYFHVTCAQREGLLSEAHHEEVDQADPFYAHCRVHSDKFLIKNRKKNYNALVMQIKMHEEETAAEALRNEKPTEEQERIERKLKSQRIKYATHKMNRPEPWVPTQKMSRSLVTSASAVKKLMKKAELMEIDSVALEFQEAQIASLTDIRKKWHIPPAFSTEFVGYYLDRSIRMREMKANLEQQVEVNKSLLEQQSTYRIKYDDTIKVNQDAQQKQKDLMNEIEQLHNAILTLSPNKQLMNIESIGKPPMSPQSSKHHTTAVTPQLSSTPPPQMITSRTMSVPTAAALKQGVGFPLNTLRKDETGRILSTQCPTNIAPGVHNDELLSECGICKKCNDQHLLVKCDTCHLYYHLGCLNPPLTKHPKKSKLYAWQCSECDKSDHSDDQSVLVIPKGPRRSRTVRYSKDGIISDIHDSFGSEKSLVNLSLPSSPIPHRIPNGDELLDFATDVAPLPPPPPPPQPQPLQEPQQQQQIEQITTEPDIIIKSSTPKTEKIKKIPRRRDSILVPPKNKNKNSIKRGRKKKEEIPEVNEVKVNEEKKIPAPIDEPEVLPIVENHVQESQEAPSVTSESTQNKPKRGRPKKTNQSIVEQNIQEQSIQEEIKNEGLLDLSQYRAFANIPNTIPAENKTDIKIDEMKSDITPQTSTTLSALSNDIMSNGEKLTNGDLLASDIASSYHKHKKRKSHKRRHSHSPSSRQSSSSGKKHKRKRKHKDHENPNTINNEHRPVDEQQQNSSIEQPRIKIKFRAILTQVGDDKTPSKLMWHVPNEAEDAAAAVSGVNSKMEQPINGHHHENGKKRKNSTVKSPSKTKNKKPRILMSLSPNKKTSQILTDNSPPDEELNGQSFESDAPQSTTSSLLNRSLPLPNEICDVCNAVGSSQNLVKCDECLKNYHFQCLIPPLKKTPKKRGYSWICADCDPTDRENN